MSEEAAASPSVYQEGFDSFEQGWPRDNCPYPPDSDGREDWLRGWNDAAAGQSAPQ